MQKTFKANILIVDDDEVNNYILNKILTNEGFNTFISSSGMEALAELHKHQIDLILLDNMMPEITGLELIDIIMCDDRLKEIPIIMLSAKIESTEIVKALDKGAVEYLKKPIEELELIARVRTTLRIRENELNQKRIYKTIEKQSMVIAESIESAKKIQTAILPAEDSLKEIFENSFIIYKPRDIVSGDFYWLEQIDNLSIIIEADCTGHGISGAFLSMIGYSLLNEIILHQGITTPIEILKTLNKEFVFALNKNFSDDNSFLFDGMDITITTINNKTGEIRISAAGQDAFIFDRDHKLTRLQGDMFSIGYDIRGEIFMDFSEYKLSKKEVKSIFMLSDGFIDQFGGDAHEKYSTRRIEEYLKLHSELKITDIKAGIINEYNKWRSDNIQTDDILIIGIEL